MYDTFVTEKVTHKSANNRIGNLKGVPEKTWRTNIPIGGMMGQRPETPTL